MTNYKNISGESNVESFEIGDDYIIVRFMTARKDGRDTYKYTNQSAGENNVRRMQELAESGMGLNSFINRFVKKRYERKW